MNVFVRENSMHDGELASGFLMDELRLLNAWFVENIAATLVL